MPLSGRDFITVRDVSREEIEAIFSRARALMPAAEGKANVGTLDGRIVAMAFFEPSTRTRLSFEAATHRLGGHCLTIADASTTSLRKGESLSDTIRMLSSYADAIVIRHPNEGAARLAADVSDRPVINAGDGSGHHPTQTVLDLATIEQTFGKIEGLKVVILGDLKYGRAVHSLVYGLALFGAELTLCSPASLRLPDRLSRELGELSVRVREVETVEDAIAGADVLYVTRIQKERFPDEAEFQKVSGSYHVDLDLIRKASDRLIVMHPLPRAGEISPEVDATPHAAYFRQAALAVPIRMAILESILEGRAPGAA